MTMTNTYKTLIIATLLVVIAALIWLKPDTGGTVSDLHSSSTGLPRLVDLGATTCVPCIKMAPILEELGETFSGQFEVEFIDVWKNPDALEPYRVKAIPTQIFYDEQGNELSRHLGFASREQVLGIWRQLGYSFPETAPASQASAQ